MNAQPTLNEPHRHKLSSRSRTLYRACLTTGIILQPLTLVALFFGVAMCNIGHGPYVDEGSYVIVGGLSGQAVSWILLAVAAAVKMRSARGDELGNALAVMFAIVVVFGGAALLLWITLFGG